MQELRLQERQQQRRLLRGQESPPLAAFLQLLLRPTQAPASPQRRVRAARHRLEPAAECGAGAASSRVRSWPSPPPETGAAAEGHRAPGPAGRRATIIRVGTRVPGFQVTVGYAAASGPQRSKNPGGGAPDRARCPIRRQRKHQMRRALTCGGVPSPPSAPGGGGAASAALSARAAQRGSTTFVAASLHRALTLGASSGEGSGRDNNTPPPPPLRRRRRPPVVAATHRRRLGSGLGLTTTPSLEPRALCGPRGWAAGRGEAGATGLRLSVGAAGVRGWVGGYFRGDGGGGVSESVAVSMGPDFLLSPPQPRAEVAELPLSSAPPLHEEAPDVRRRPRLAPPLPSPLLVRRRESHGTCWLGPNLRNPSSSPGSFGFFPSALTYDRERARTSRSEKAEDERWPGQERREQSCRALACSLPPGAGGPHRK